MPMYFSIIIVNWNGAGVLPDCLKSIVENPPTVDYEIVVVDNVSSDNSVEWLKSNECLAILKGTKFTLIENEENLGFGKANNLAIERTDAPYVFLLNPDTIVRQNAIDALLETLKSQETIGAVAPKLLSTDGTLQHSVWKFPPKPLSILVVGLRLYRIIPKRLLANWLYGSHWNYQKREAVPAFSGAAMMVKREMINQIKAFDEDFFMYGEDVEWCFRMNRNGWKTYFEPNAEIYHLGGQSAVQRWGETGSRVKEEEGFVYCQSKCLPKYLFVLNSMTRMSVLSFHYIKNFIAGNDCAPLAATIKLHLGFLKSVLGIR